MNPTAITWAIRLAPYLLIAAVAAWVLGMRSDLAEVRRENVALAAAVKASDDARRRDVAALTSLSSGLVAASSAKDADQKALSETIDAKNPTPVSAGLGALLACLRDTDAGRQCADATPGSGGAVAR